MKTEFPKEFKAGHAAAKAKAAFGTGRDAPAKIKIRSIPARTGGL